MAKLTQEEVLKRIEMTKLTNATTLDLSHNQLRTLPPEIAQLTNLTELYLNDNQLTTLPPEIALLTNLTAFVSRSNPLASDLMAAYEKGTPALFNYLRRLADSETLYEVKLVFVGEGDVGKSTLLDALLGNPPVKNRPTTEGMEIARKPIPLPHPDGSHTLQCNAWDFGGQKIYRVQHQFFFSKNAVYLLVWDPRSGPQKCDVEGWLERIRLRVGDEARVLIVSSYANDKKHPPRISETELRDRYGKLIYGFYPVDGIEHANSAELKRLLDELKVEIANAAASLTGRKFPRTWQAVRKEVAALKAKETCLTFTEFVTICRKRELTELDTTTLAAIMNEIGDFVYFENAALDAAAFDPGDCPAENDNILVLQPEWLAKAIGFVLEDAKMSKQADGVVPHDELTRIWRAKNYAADLHPYFLWLMEEFLISYRLTPDRRSLVPQLITEIRPDNLRWEPGVSAPQGERELNLICRMEQNPPPGIVPQMIAASHTFRYKNLDPLDRNWQNGAFFDRGQHGEALMELKDRELWLTVRNGYPNFFLRDLRQTLEKRIADVWPGLVYRLVVPCPTPVPDGFCKGRFQIGALETALRDGDETYRCQECNIKIPIRPLLEGINHSSIAELTRLMKLMEANQENAFSISLDFYRRLLVAIGTESKEAPCMFTLAPIDKSNNPAIQKYRLTLWCEWPDGPHRCCEIGSGEDGEYTFERPKEWFKKVSPYVRVLSKILKVIAPMVERAGEAAFGSDAMKDSKPEYDLLEKSEPLLPGEVSGKFGIPEAQALRLEGAALRLIHDLLQEQVPKKGRSWGGLERIGTRSGEYIWLCDKHAREYDPGLPKMD